MTPSDGEMIATLDEIARTQLEWSGRLTRESRLVETLELDSLRRLTLLVEIEDRFRVSFDEEDETAIETVGDLLELIRRKGAFAGRDAR